MIVPMPALLTSIIVSVCLGALVGLIRQWSDQRESGGEVDFGGVRTFSLWALLGCVGSHLSGVIASAVLHFTYKTSMEFVVSEHFIERYHASIPLIAELALEVPAAACAAVLRLESHGAGSQLCTPRRDCPRVCSTSSTAAWIPSTFSATTPELIEIYVSQFFLLSDKITNILI
jgi:hypothetical protein